MFLKKVKKELPYDPEIPLLDIYPEKTIIQKEHVPQCSLQHYLQQPGHGSNLCPSTDEWIKKMWHIYTMEYYSAIKRNEIELFVLRWWSVIPCEVSQKEKNKYCMLMHIYGI